MRNLEDELRRRLDDLEAANLRRRLREVESPQGPRIVLEGRPVLNFSSNDYLGLAAHPRVKAAAQEAIERYGAGSGAARLVCGSLAPHHLLETNLAAFKNTEAALAFSSGCATALGTITALAGREDIIVLDRLVHASIVDAAKLSGAKLRVFAHNNVEDLDKILKWCDRKRAANSGTHILIITESVFSMDGDEAPLREIVALKERYGAWLMVDEAHASGFLGAKRTGLCEELGVNERVEVQMGTLGKALGSAGGYIAGSRTLIDYLVNKARAFIFSTAPPPSASAAAAAAIEIVCSNQGAELVSKLNRNLALFFKMTGFVPAAKASPIFPLILGPETAALDSARALLDSGIFAPAIRYPTVPRNQARIRFTFSAGHNENQIAELAARIRDLKLLPDPARAL